MTTLTKLLPALLAISIVAAACDSDKEEAADSSGVTNEDVVQVSDLLVADSSGAGAIKVGDPAELLAAAARESKDSIEKIRSIVQRMGDVATSVEPARKGKTALGQPYGVWSGVREGADVKFIVTRTAPDRARYLVLGRKEGDTGAYKGLLTGIFIKKAPRKGGGRIHLNLTNISDITGGAPDASGSAHVWWANFRDGTVARRVAYRALIDRTKADSPPRNYGMDYIQKTGTGGRFRTLAIGDYVPVLNGPELLGLRVLWSTSEGGRADGVLLSLSPYKVLGHINECWDRYGKRTANYNDNPADDADNPNEGDTNACAGFPKDDKVPEPKGAEGSDVDPEVDAELTEVGATAITEAEAEDASNPEG